MLVEPLLVDAERLVLLSVGVGEFFLLVGAIAGRHWAVNMPVSGSVVRNRTLGNRILIRISVLVIQRIVRPLEEPVVFFV